MQGFYALDLMTVSRYIDPVSPYPSLVVRGDDKVDLCRARLGQANPCAVLRSKNTG